MPARRAAKRASLAVGFAQYVLNRRLPHRIAMVGDQFAEYHHPGSAIMTEIVDDLALHRGPVQRKALWRSMLLAGFRFSATNLLDPRTRLPRTVALTSG